MLIISGIKMYRKLPSYLTASVNLFSHKNISLTIDLRLIRKLAIDNVPEECPSSSAIVVAPKKMTPKRKQICSKIKKPSPKKA
jgi:hypothetical protein